MSNSELSKNRNYYKQIENQLSIINTALTGREYFVIKINLSHDKVLKGEIAVELLKAAINIKKEGFKVEFPNDTPYFVGQSACRHDGLHISSVDRDESVLCDRFYIDDIDETVNYTVISDEEGMTAYTIASFKAISNLPAIRAYLSGVPEKK